MSDSTRRVILQMFEQDYQYFPTLREIRDGLIKGQMKVLEDDKEDWSEDTDFGSVTTDYEADWQKLFALKSLGDLDKPLKRGNRRRSHRLS